MKGTGKEKDMEVIAKFEGFIVYAQKKSRKITEKQELISKLNKINQSSGV